MAGPALRVCAGMLRCDRPWNVIRLTLMLGRKLRLKATLQSSFSCFRFKRCKRAVSKRVCRCSTPPCARRRRSAARRPYCSARRG